MKIIPSLSRHHYLAKVGIFLIVATLIAGIVGCEGEGEIWRGDYYCLNISSTYGGNVTEPGKGIFTCYSSDVVDLVAVPDEHYHFVEWTGDVSTIADVYDASTTVTINDSYSITANFELDPGWYSLTISGTPGNSVTAPGEGTFIYSTNTTVALVAEDGEHYHFVNWIGDAGTIANVNSTNTTIIMNDNYSITASFELDPGWYSLTMSSTVGGSVITPGEGVSTHAANTTVALLAQPDDGYEFVKWTGDVATITDVYDTATEITMYDSYSITVNFAAGFMVVAGATHTVGIRSDGKVLAVGSNSYGQCNVGSWTDITQVAAGDLHTVGLKSDGTVVAVGDNQGEQCNVGDWTDIIQVACGSTHTVGLKSDGTVVAVGYCYDGQCNVDSWTDITQIAADYVDTMGLEPDGTVVAVGYNGHGQCNVDSWTDITQVDTGGPHTVGIKNDSTVVAVGWNRFGQCDVGCWTDIIQVAAGGDHTVGLESDGTVVAVGRDWEGQCVVGGWTDIIQVSAGGSHTVGLKPDGTVVAVGRNNHGQCNVSGWDLIV